jgi:hypothetical protein
MPQIAVVTMYTRRPNMSPEEFKAYFEDHHMKLIKKAFGGFQPLSYTRRYVERVGSGLGDRLGAAVASRKNNHPDTPVCLIGMPQDLGWDMQGEMVFRDELHLQQGLAQLGTTAGQAVRDDEENFAVPHLLKIVLLGTKFES